MSEPFLVERAPEEFATLLLAHGAGAPMDSDFMNAISTALVAQGVSVWRFEFPYMRERRESGKKRPPNPQDTLIDSWCQSIEQARAQCHTPLFIGGKSMGARMACIAAHRMPLAAVVCLGYPFHPPGKPERLRLEPLQRCPVPVWIAQGSRDKLGDRQEVAGYSLPANVETLWLEDGDHDLKPRVRSGLTHRQHIDSAAAGVAAFLRRQL